MGFAFVVRRRFEGIEDFIFDGFEVFKPLDVFPRLSDELGGRRPVVGHLELGDVRNVVHALGRQWPVDDGLMEDFPHRYWRQRFLMEDDDQVEGSEVGHRDVAPGVGVRELVVVDH